MTKANPLLRTPLRQARRHAVVLSLASVATLVILVIVANLLGSPARNTATPSSPAPETSSIQSPAQDSADPPSDDQGGQHTRIIQYQCPTECTLLLTATGEADVQLSLDHQGVLSASSLVGDEGTAALQVTGAGTFQATATATGWVDLTVKAQ